MPFPSEAFTKDFSKLQDPLLSTAGIIQIKPSLQGTDIKAFTAGATYLPTPGAGKQRPPERLLW